MVAKKILKCWKKVPSKTIYKNKKGDEVGLLKWSKNEYHVLVNPKKGKLKKIGELKTKSSALKKAKAYMKKHDIC